MTAEEYIKSNLIETYPSNNYVVPEEVALKAIEIARNEKSNAPAGMQGWICPKCGRVYSPYTSLCTFCGNADAFKVTCDYRL